jgi:hypothetical protein
MSTKNFIKDFLLEQDDNLVRISPDQYLETLESVGGIASRIAMLKPFKGKGIVIDGDLDLRKFNKVGPLTGIVRVKGRLDISNTNVPSLDGITVDGYVSNYNSTMFINKLRNEKNQKLTKLAQYRKDDEWNIENGKDESERTEALYDYLYEKGIPERIEYEDGSENEEDKYFIYPNGGGNYGYGKQYEWLGGGTLTPSNYDVYTERELEIAAHSAVESMIDDMGINAFSEWVFNDALDREKWNEWLIDFYEESVYEDPEGYEVEKELSGNQYQQVRQMELTIQGLNKKLQDVNLSDQDRKTIETKINGLDQTIEEIKDDPEGDYDDDSVRDIAESMASEYNDDITAFMEAYGFDKKFILDFIDTNELADIVVRSDGYGNLLSSSGEDMFETRVNDKFYYIIPID